jgi:c-di-GMP-binding flagellar brake protein YcgR
MEQKRVYKRIEDLIEVEFVAESQGTTTKMITKTRDISAGGIKVYLNSRLKTGDRMQLLITLPRNTEVIRSEAEVVRSDLIGVVGDRGEEMLYETRFTFRNMSPELKNKITRYIYACRQQKLDAKQKN